jgi:hypothetical protein
MSAQHWPLAVCALAFLGGPLGRQVAGLPLLPSSPRREVDAASAATAVGGSVASRVARRGAARRQAVQSALVLCCAAARMGVAAAPHLAQGRS